MIGPDSFFKGFASLVPVIGNEHFVNMFPQAFRDHARAMNTRPSKAVGDASERGNARLCTLSTS